MYLERYERQAAGKDMETFLREWDAETGTAQQTGPESGDRE